MTLTLGTSLQNALTTAAKQAGVTPEELAVRILSERHLPPKRREPRDEWERELQEIAIDCGVSPPDEAFLAENLY